MRFFFRHPSPPAFEFLDPSPLIDHELELVAPTSKWVADVLSSLQHPMTVANSPAAMPDRAQIERFLANCPGGHETPQPQRNVLPTYHFWMRLLGPQPPVPIAGAISIRIGSTRDTDLYYGHLGYHVHPPARGRHYAERACRLLLPLARRHGMKTIWITTNPDNAASRRSIERLGARFVETVPIPIDHPLYLAGDREKCRYRLELASPGAPG